MSEKEFPVLSDPAYRIEAELGEGGGGVVYKAWHTRLQKHVVLKRIKDESGLLQSSRQRGEADILKNLKHANLPQLYDFLEDPGGVYTVIEFIPGQSFAELLKEGQKFTQQQAVRWAEQLASALSYLHGQTPPVLHSDIKPGNIMLAPEGDVCLIDFNISLVLAGEDTEMIGLSHGYASPEQYGPQELPRAASAARGKQPAAAESADGFTDVETVYTRAGGGDTDVETVYTRTGGGGVADAETVYTQPGGKTAADVDTDVDTDFTGAGPAATDFTPGAPPAYPQQAAQQPLPPSSARRRAVIRLDARSDIYSLGATLYHIVTGEKPALATGQVKPLSKFKLPLSKAFVYIIERCMEPDPARRFQSAAGLHEAVANIHRLDGRWKSHRRKTAMAAALLTVLFALSCATALFGWQRMAAEAEEAYNSHVLRIAGEDGEAAYGAAVAMFPENPAAYRERALKLYQAGRYEDCIEYVREAIAKLSAYGHDEAGILKIGEIYYIQGNAYFESEDDVNALAAYEAAIRNNPGNADIYRDYAIALVRRGDIRRAEDMLSDMSSMNLGSDSLNLLRGEIAYATGDDESAIRLLKEVLRETGSDHIRSRAYLICDRAYRRLPDLVDDEIALLQDALRELPANYMFFIRDRLADAYARAGDYSEAIRLLEELRRGGGVAFATWQNIGVLYQRIGDFDGARAVFGEMLAAYPNDYRPPMRLAYLGLEEQGALPADDRDYGEAAAYYQQARALSPADDMEMIILDGLIAELRQNNWIE